MTTISGTIQDIADQTRGDHLKSLVTLKAIDNQTAFIEFRGPIKNRVEKIGVGTDVEILIFFNGSRSKKNGMHFNNLVAKKVTKI